MNELIRPDRLNDDDEIEYSLRPQKLAEFIGQEKVKENLAIYIKAALQRGEAGSCTFVWASGSW